MSLISTEGLESALREILDRLAKQSQDISNLRTELSNAATRSEVQALEKAISTRIGSLERRIDRLELETSLDIPLDVLDANIAGGLELNESSFDGNRCVSFQSMSFFSRSHTVSVPITDQAIPSLVFPLLAMLHYIKTTSEACTTL